MTRRKRSRKSKLSYHGRRASRLLLLPAAEEEEEEEKEVGRGEALEEKEAEARAAVKRASWATTRRVSSGGASSERSRTRTLNKSRSDWTHSRDREQSKKVLGVV